MPSHSSRRMMSFSVLLEKISVEPSSAPSFARARRIGM